VINLSTRPREDLDIEASDEVLDEEGKLKELTKELEHT